MGLFPVIIRIRTNYLLQIALLAATAACSWFATTSGSYTPIVRISAETAIQGITSGILAAGFILLLELLLILFIAPLRGELDAAAKKLYAGSGFRAAGGIIAAAVGEEVLIRGLAFGYLERSSLGAAFAVSALLSTLFWLSSPRRPWLPLIKGAEGTLFAIFFWYNRSLFLVVVAHAAAEAIAMLIYRRGAQASPIFRAARWLSREIRTRFGIKLLKIGGGI